MSNSSDSTVLYARNCLDTVNQNQQPQPFCHTEALAVGILPERKKHKQVSTVVLSLGIVGGTLGGVALVLLIFFIVRRGNDRSKTKNPPTRLISENAASGYTSKLLSDASNSLSLPLSLSLSLSLKHTQTHTGVCMIKLPCPILYISSSTTCRTFRKFSDICKSN